MLILNSESGRTSVMVLGLTALLVVAGCDSGGDGGSTGGGAAGGPAAGGGEKSAGPEAAKTPEGTATPAAGAVVQVDPATAGTISGTVTFSGNPPPKPPPIQFNADPNCAAMHKEPAFPEEVVINDG